MCETESRSRGVDHRLAWLGRATVLLALSGVRLLTDPELRSRVAHLRRRAPEPADPGTLDAVLVSHAHRDHLDPPVAASQRCALRRPGERSPASPAAS